MKAKTQVRARAEALRLAELLPEQARLAVSDRISRAFLDEGDARIIALDFNANLVTQLRTLAERRHTPNLWAC